MTGGLRGRSGVDTGGLAAVGVVSNPGASTAVGDNTTSASEVSAAAGLGLVLGLEMVPELLESGPVQEQVVRNQLRC